MNRKILAKGLAVFLLVALTAGCAGKPESAGKQPIELNISAAMGLKEVLTDIQKDYENTHPGIKLVYNLGAAGALQKQIEQGAPADIFISAANQQVNELETKGLLAEGTRRPLVGNQLVLIVSKDAKQPIKSFQELEMIQSFGLGAPETVPAGQYGIEVLTKLGIWNSVKDKAVLAKDVRTIVTHVETGNVDAGIVFSTVAATSDKVTVVASAPEGSHEPIIFPAAMLKSTKHAKEAKEFLDYLEGNEGMKVFKKYGFTALSQNQ